MMILNIVLHPFKCSGIFAGAKLQGVSPALKPPAASNGAGRGSAMRPPSLNADPFLAPGGLSTDLQAENKASGHLGSSWQPVQQVSYVLTQLPFDVHQATKRGSLVTWGGIEFTKVGSCYIVDFNKWKSTLYGKVSL